MSFIHNIDPAIVHLGPLEVRWYGLVYVLGALLGLYFLQRARKKGELPLSKDETYDFVFWLMVGVIAGARLFEVFWEPSLYLSNPLEILKIWHGGMSFHGGLVGIFLAAWLYCKKKKLDFWHVADTLSLPLILALALGRIANFINGELWGTPTDLAWCVQFPAVDGCRHPYQLYEAAKRFVIFGILLAMAQSKRRETWKKGTIFFTFLFLENTGRFALDFVRDETRYLGLTMGQYISAVVIVLAVLYLLSTHFKKKKELPQ